MSHVGILQSVITTTSSDEAESLAGYLTEHGVFATVADVFEVRIATEDSEHYDEVDTLLITWKMFWEHSDSGLFGLPMFVKES